MQTRRECWCQDFASFLTGLMKPKGTGRSLADRQGGLMKHTERTADEAHGAEDGMWKFGTLPPDLSVFIMYECVIVPAGVTLKKYQMVGIL